MSQEYYRHARITEDNRGPLVNIAAWILVVSSSLFTIFRLVSNRILLRRVPKDDWAMCATTALAVAQTVATSFIVKNGIGQHQSTLSDVVLRRYDQSTVASSILYIATLMFSKFSLLLFLTRMLPVPTKTFKRLMQGTWAILLLYLISAIFVLSFQCKLPRTYDFMDGKCMNLLAFWDFDAAFDFLTGLLILALPVIVIAPLRMSKSLKFTAIQAFIFQLPACAFAIVRLVYLHRALASEDLTWSAVDWQVWTQVNLHFNLVAANLPCLKTFLSGFQSVLFRPNLATRLGVNSRGGKLRPNTLPDAEHGIFEGPSVVTGSTGNTSSCKRASKDLIRSGSEDDRIRATTDVTVSVTYEDE